ncbi:MAG: hypothetical protein M1541_22115, partial [Acidobacteria bacterium]|nr:hypothetical protein [Acidobacteriota bacterium]
MFKYLLLAVALWVPAAWSQTPANCAPQDVSLGGTINGQLTSASCNLDTLFNWSPAFAQVYRFAITQRGTVTLEMTASFDSRLYLLDARGNFRASSHRTNGLAVRVFEALEPGTYQVVAAAADRSTGPFRLTSWFRNAQICPVTQISLDTSQSGTLDADSCRAGDLMFGTSNEDFAAQFRFSVSQRGTISIDASSDLYEARVYLLDSRYNFRTSSRTVSYSTTRTFEALDPGTYIIVVTARDGASGAFSLKGIFRNPQICPKAPIGLSASAGGLFSPSSCRVGDLMFGNSNEGFAVQYTLTLAKRGTLTVDAASEEVRPGIYLTDARYNFITSSRVVASGQAHTFESLDPGSYVVIVFAQPEETGAYTVKTDFRNPEICPSENLANNSIDGDALTSSSCKVGDLLFGSWNENYAKQYRIHLSQRMPLVVGMHSEDFDSVLYLTDSKFNFLTSDDNSGQGFDARI